MHIDRGESTPPATAVDDYAAYVDDLVKSWPPPTAAQAARVADLLPPPRAGRASTPERMTTAA